MKLFKFLALSAFLISQPVFSQDSSSLTETSLEEASCHRDHCKHHGHHHHHHESHHRAFGANINVPFVANTDLVLNASNSLFSQIALTTPILLTTPLNSVVVWDPTNNYFVLNKKGLYLVNFNASLALNNTLAVHLDLNNNPISSSYFSYISTFSSTESFTVLIDNQEAPGAILNLSLDVGTVLRINISSNSPKASLFNFNIVYLGETHLDHSSSSSAL